MMYICAFTLLLSLLPQFTRTAAPSTLKLVNVVYRHGDRAPVMISRNDSHQANEWSVDLGWITPRGMEQHFRLGQWLRKRYDGFLSKRYIHSEIEIQSSDVERCLMSAQCNLAGLYYPPHGPVVDNTNITLLPIPIHTRPVYDDPMVVMAKPCPKYDKLHAEVLDRFRATDEEKRNEALYKFVASHSGVKYGDSYSENIYMMMMVSDTAFCEKEHGMKLDDWLYNTSFGDFTNDTVYGKLRRMQGRQLYLYFNGQQARLTGGVLLGQFVKNMWNMAKNATFYENTTKMFMYSGHGSTVAAILTAMGIFNEMDCPYASTVITELHYSQGRYHVNVLYKNETSGNNYLRMNLPGCDFDCPLDKFVSLTEHNIPEDRDKECALQSKHISAGSPKQQAGWLTITTLIGLFQLLK